MLKFCKSHNSSSFQKKKSAYMHWKNKCLMVYVCSEQKVHKLESTKLNFDNISFVAMHLWIILYCNHLSDVSFVILKGSILIIFHSWSLKFTLRVAFHLSLYFCLYRKSLINLLYTENLFFLSNIIILIYEGNTGRNYLVL